MSALRLFEARGSIFTLVMRSGYDCSDTINSHRLQFYHAFSAIRATKFNLVLRYTAGLRVAAVQAPRLPTTYKSSILHSIVPWIESAGK